jgi:hypothetical protein
VAETRPCPARISLSSPTSTGLVNPKAGDAVGDLLNLALGVSARVAAIEAQRSRVSKCDVQWRLPSADEAVERTLKAPNLEYAHLPARPTRLSGLRGAGRVGGDLYVQPDCTPDPVTLLARASCLNL